MARIVKKPEERRREIIAMAQKLFLEKEYETTSLNDIVSGLGVAKGTVYHYFKSKEELLDAVVSNMASDFLELVQKKLKIKKGDALTQMKAMSSAMNVSTEWKDTMDQLHRPGNRGLHVRLLGALIRGISPIMADILKKGCEEGIFKTDYPLEAAEVLLAGIQFVTDVGIYPWSKDELERRMNAIPALAEMFLQAPKGSLVFLGK
jgi:AcrR family transcriptional regulator